LRLKPAEKNKNSEAEVILPGFYKNKKSVIQIPMYTGN